MSSSSRKENADVDADVYDSSDHHRLSRRQERAMGRWKLLRAALLGQEDTVKKNRNDMQQQQQQQQHSIHRFAGYNLLSSIPIRRNDDDGNDDEYASLRRCLLRYATRKFDKTDNGVVSVTQHLRLCLTALKTLAYHHHYHYHHQEQSIQLPGLVVVDETEIRNQITKSLCQEEDGNYNTLSIERCEWTAQLDDDDDDDDDCNNKNDPKQQQQLWTLIVHWKQPKMAHPPWQYHIQRYDGFLPTMPKNHYHRHHYHSCHSIYIHERLPASQRKLTLRELTSHHQQQVDNTGNICVWDCEKTLTWFLHHHQHQHQQVVEPEQQQQQQQHDAAAPHFILPPNAVLLELGVGMAGLAALSWYGVAKEIYLTDGNEDCVWNNCVNSLLMQATMQNMDNNNNNDDDDDENNDNTRNHLSTTTQVHCQLLRWSYDTTTTSTATSLQADWTLVSDCTHFQEWHGQLLWTLVWHTRVGGCIWMCQPNRGRSWERFENLIRIVNEKSNIDHPLVDIQEEINATLEEKHVHYMKTDSSYQPDIHRPRIFRLKKLREATLHDQETMKQHIGIRDSKESDKQNSLERRASY